MSEKRSDRLRSIIAATVTDAADDAAPVTVTGSGMTRADQRDSRVRAASPPEPADIPSRSESVLPHPPAEFSAVEPAYEHRAPADLSVQPQSVRSSTPTAPTAIASVRDSSATQSAARSPLRAPEGPTRLPKWEKANVTLEPRDLAILRRSDAEARAYGFRIRKGGNPSLFVRAGLRLLDELIDRDPEGWIKRIADTTPIGADNG